MYEHVVKMEENRTQRMAKQYKTTSKKKGGRPRRTRLNGIMEAMQEGAIEKEWSLDRPRWREV